MEIKLEIGENLRGAIEKLIEHSVGENSGMEIQDAFRIDFMKLIKEHTDAGIVRLEVKKTLDLANHVELRHILAPLIGVEPGDISKRNLDILITIAKGIFWSAELNHEIVKLEKIIKDKLAE